MREKLKAPMVAVVTALLNAAYLIYAFDVSTHDGNLEERLRALVTADVIAVVGAMLVRRGTIAKGIAAGSALILGLTFWLIVLMFSH